MRISIYIVISAYLLIKVISGEKMGNQQADQLTGAQLYAKYCLTCHQADGNGVRGQFPPLSGNSKVTGPATDVIRIVLFGLEGPITVNERDYNQLMPAQGYLTDKQIADILSYVRSSWENKATSVTADDVAKTRKLGKPAKSN
jgi:mono/diheme cytochrome c family protein